MTKKFWAAVGSVGIFYLMAYVVQNVITLVPYMFGIGKYVYTSQRRRCTDPQDIGASLW